MFSLWLQTGKSLCWCVLIQALYTVGLNKVAEEATEIHQQNSCNSEDANKTHVHPQNSLEDNALPRAGEGSFKPETEEDKFNLQQFTNYLKDIPDVNLFALKLLPQNSVLTVIEENRCSCGNTQDKLLRICKAFLK